jgi:hypothetical protein
MGYYIMGAVDLGMYALVFFFGIFLGFSAALALAVVAWNLKDLNTW